MAFLDSQTNLEYHQSCLLYNSPMQSVSELGMHARISTSLSEHLVQVWQGLVLLCSSENVPGLHIWHCVSPCGPHSRVTPSPWLHSEQDTHRPYLPKKKKPLSHSHCVSWVAEQKANMGTPDGHLAQGEQGSRPSVKDNVPKKEIKKLSVWINCVAPLNISCID